MRLKITMEIEIGDMTDEQREELEDGISFVSRDKIGTDGLPADENAEDYVPPVPTLAEQNPEEVIGTITEAMSFLIEWQEDVWAGSDVYARISKISNVNVEEVDEPPCVAQRLLQTAEAEGLTMRVYAFPDEVDYEGTSARDAWEHVLACEEMHVSFHRENADLGRAFILPDLDPDERVSDYAGAWVQNFFEKQGNADG
ncbi:hypothetical protein JYP52_21390 [Nitratireductor aquibiodomus]|uniref:hypothetical protein n=1 Tax=Nitratireductor aquibiodomus TaxID=204799 RepID=UPI0019D3F414|nr:hypothetical protein [Nitratireductor aquibiodomus]MBN7763696.1 hypothetical protein [Nitratireductor aquibiodomus]